MLRLSFSLKLDRGSYIVFVIKIAFKKTKALVFFMELLISDLAVISIKLPYKTKMLDNNMLGEFLINCFFT